MKTLFLGLFFALYANLSSCADPSLRYVVTIFRHGDRSAIHYFPTDPNPASSWPDGPGQLSDRGLAQHFELGKWMRKRYDGFLSATFKRGELYVRSTDYERTLMSAEAHLAGLYWSSERKYEWNKQLNWKPIPIHTAPQFEDTLLDDDAPCPLYDSLYNQTYEPIRKHVETLDASFFGFLDEKSQLRDVPPGIQQATRLWDTLYCETQHGMQKPDWFNSTIFDQLTAYRGLDWFTQFNTEAMIRLRVGLFFKEVLTRLFFARNSTAPSTSSGTTPSSRTHAKWNSLLDSKLLDPNHYLSLHKVGQKFSIYSGHDSNLVGLLRAFDQFYNVSPPYASCIIFELHQFEKSNGNSNVRSGNSGSDNFFVKLLFINNTVSALSESAATDGVPKFNVFELKLAGCSSRWCTLDELANSLARFIPNDWHAECQLTAAGTNWFSSILVNNAASFFGRLGVLLSASALGLAIIILCRRRCRYLFFRRASHPKPVFSRVSRTDSDTKSLTSALGASDGKRVRHSCATN